MPWARGRGLLGSARARRMQVICKAETARLYIDYDHTLGTWAVAA